MSSNRMRVLLVSLLAVFAVSAVASASASAVTTSFCYKVAVAGTGNKDSSCITNVGATKNEYINVSKLETNLAAGEWCAKVFTGGTGTFEKNTCAGAVGTKEFIKVLAPNLEWEVCEASVAGKGIEPPAKYDEHKCNTQAKVLAEREWEFKKLGAGVTDKIISSGGEFVLNKGKATAIKCTGVTDKGTITGGKPGKDEATEIHFSGCTAGTCKVKSKSPPDTRAGTIIATAIPTKLEERKIGGAGVEVDNFEQNATTKEFVTLEVGEEEVEEPMGSGKFVLKKKCGVFPLVSKVKGSVAAKTGIGTGELNFPEPEIEKDTLEAFGAAATLTGKVTVELENGWAVRAS